MPTKPEDRNYRKEAARETPERKEQRRMRQRARYEYEKKHGNLPTDMQVDHIKPLSQGGSNAASNLRVLPKARNESFRRDGPGGKQKGKA